MNISDCFSIQGNKHFLLLLTLRSSLVQVEISHVGCLDIHGSQRVNPIDLDDPVFLFERITSKCLKKKVFADMSITYSENISICRIRVFLYTC